MENVGTKTIETKRLILRRIGEDDYPLVFKNWTSDQKVCRYLTWDKHENIDATKKYIKFKAERYEQKDYIFDWAVVLKETNEPIGEIEATIVSQLHNSAEMGNCYGSEYWNKGYATEALTAFIDYMFSEAKVDKVIACHISTNPASGRVMQKAGMHLDAILPGYFIDKNTGKREGQVWYSIDNPNTKK